MYVKCKNTTWCTILFTFTPSKHIQPGVISMLTNLTTISWALAGFGRIRQYFLAQFIYDSSLQAPAVFVAVFALVF